MTLVLSSGGTATCVTDSSGQCSVASPPAKKRAAAITFTVTDVAHPNLNYDDTADHDPDGDSDGIVITVLKP